MVTLLSLSCFVGALLSNSPYDRGVQLAACTQARSAYAQGHYLEAGLQFEAHRENSSDDDLQLQAAQFYLESGKYDRAAHLTKDVLVRAPSSAKAMYLLGHIEERRKNARESLSWFTKAAALKIPEASDLRTVGLDYVLLDDYADATHWFTRAVALDPQDSEAWYDLGRAQMTQGDAGAAEASLKRALALKPHLVKAENNLGVTYEAENRSADAANAYRLAITWQQDAPHPSEQPLLNLGTLLITQQRAAEAVPLLRQAVVLAPQNSKTHEELARALDGIGNLKGALPEMERAVQCDLKDPALHYQLGQMARRLGKVELAREQLHLSAELYAQSSSSTVH